MIIGNGAANLIDGFGGADTLIGGAGVDTLSYESSDEAVSVTLRGTLTALVSGGHATGDIASGFENVIGSAYADAVTGDGGANRLDGRAGADSMAGGAGHDVYVVDDAGDTVWETMPGGIDTVLAGVSYALADHIERLTLTGTADIDATGNELANILTGNSGNNRLDGGLGADRMAGRFGDDTYVVNATTDVVVEGLGAGTDTIEASVTLALGAYVENLTLTGTANLNGTGNALNNVITGNGGHNVLNGGLGADTMAGGAGDDTLIGGAGLDELTGDGGKDVFVFNTALSATTNVDTITDFSLIDDVIHLENAIFMRLAAVGALAEANFCVGLTAQDANHFIIYDDQSGALFYDANGSAVGGQIQFVTLAASLTLTEDSFRVI